MSTKSKQNRIKRIVTFPIRVLVKARDSYVKGMTSFGEKGTYGGFSDPKPVSHSSNLPKSYSVSSSGSNYESEDMRELIRAASVKRLGGHLSDDLSRRPMALTSQTGPSTGVVPRSCSVGMGKIDENSPCEFGEENMGLGISKGDAMYPRSKSYAPVAKRSISEY